MAKSAKKPGKRPATPSPEIVREKPGPPQGTGPFSHFIPNDVDKQIELLDPLQEERVIFLIELYGKAYTKRAIIWAFRDRYKLSLEHTYRYLKIAEHRIMEESAGTSRQKVQQAVNRVKTIVRQAQEVKDFRAAIVAEKHLEELQGILRNMDPQRPSPTNGGEEDGGQHGGTPEVDDGSLKALADLIAGAAAKNGGLQPPALDAPQHQAG